MLKMKQTLYTMTMASPNMKNIIIWVASLQIFQSLFSLIELCPQNRYGVLRCGIKTAQASG